MVKIEGQFARDVVGDDCSMHMDRAFRRSSGAAGEVQEGRVFGTGRSDAVGAGCLFEQVMNIVCAGSLRGWLFVADEQDMLKMGQRLSDPGHFALIQRLRGHQHLGLADRQPGADGLRAERGEERTEDGAMFQCTQRRDVQLRNAAGEDEDPISLGDPQPLKCIGKAIAQVVESRIGIVLDLPAFPQPPDGGLLSERTACMPHHRFMGDVQSLPLRQAIQFGTRLLPRKVFSHRLVIVEIRDRLPVSSRFDDGVPRHCAVHTPRTDSEHAFCKA